jgi:hypothetical protein
MTNLKASQTQGALGSCRIMLALTCAQPRKSKQLQNFTAQMQSQLVYRLELQFLPHEGKILLQKQ